MRVEVQAREGDQVVSHLVFLGKSWLGAGRDVEVKGDQMTVLVSLVRIGKARTTTLTNGTYVSSSPSRTVGLIDSVSIAIRTSRGFVWTTRRRSVLAGTLCLWA